MWHALLPLQPKKRLIERRRVWGLGQSSATAVASGVWRRDEHSQLVRNFIEVVEAQGTVPLSG